MSQLTHTDEQGRAVMVDVSGKDVTARRAVASALVKLNTETVSAIRQARTPKGDALEVARLAGILAAKRTDELIPLCHTLPLSRVDVRAELRDDGVHLEAEAATTHQTGVEMEAMLAVSIAALTIYDMTKALDKSITICDIRLEAKTGGKSGDWQRRDENRE